MADDAIHQPKETGIETRREVLNPIQGMLNPVLFPPILEDIKFNGFNLEDWSEYVEMILESRGLDEHLRSEVEPGQPRYQIWRREDSNVRSWLLSNLAGNRFRKYLYLKTVKKLWDHLQRGRIQKSNTWHLYELVMKASTLVQGDMPVAEYAEELQSTWLAIDHFQPIKNPDKWQSTLQNRMF